MLTEDRKMCVFINKEEHLELVYNDKDTPDLLQGFLSVYEVIESLKKEFKFAFKQSYGHISSNPKYVGTCLRMKVYFEIREEQIETFKHNLEDNKLHSHFIKVEEFDSKNHIWVMKNDKCAGFTEIELLRGFLETFIFLFTGTTQTDPVNVESSTNLGKENKGPYQSLSMTSSHPMSPKPLIASPVNQVFS
mmetsp:Transcript_16255/g.13891  ORF Transcript_16255/g.13891 Transcript_16255/m.13891 type:complete len:191 (+) Transcript_16255:661-1233(+)